MIKSIARHGTILVVVAAAAAAAAAAIATHAFEQQYLYDEGYHMIIIDKRGIESLIRWNGAIVTAITTTTTTTNAFEEHHLYGVS